MIIQPLTQGQTSPPRASTSSRGIKPLIEVSQPILQRQAPAQTAQPSAQPSLLERAKPILGQIKTALTAIPGHIKAAAQKPKTAVSGIGVETIKFFGGSLAGSIQQGIAAITQKPVPERWDLKKQAKAFEELASVNLDVADVWGETKDEKSKQAFEVGKFLGDFVPYYFASAIAGATVGAKILAPLAAKFAPKAVKLAPKISEVIGFTGVGQLEFDEQADGTRVERLKTDVIMLGLFEAGGALAKGISKGTSKLISKSVKSVSTKLKGKQPVAIEEVEKVVVEAKAAIVKDTGKPAEVVLANNIVNAGDDQLKLLAQPKTKLLEAPKPATAGEGFTFTEKAEKSKLDIAKKVAAYNEAFESFNKNPTPVTRQRFEKARVVIDKLKENNYLTETKPASAPTPTITKLTPTKAKALGTPAPTEVKPKTVSVPKEQLPVGSGKEKVSRLEARMKGLLDKTPEEVKEQLGTVTFNQMNKKENIEAAAKFVTENPKEALAVLKGDKNPPKGILRNSVFVAMERQAQGDVDLATRLASFSSTRGGQEISILTEIDPDSPVKAMGELIKIRADAVKTRTGKPVEKAIKDEVAKIKQQIPTKYDWGTFLESIRC